MAKLKLTNGQEIEYKINNSLQVIYDKQVICTLESEEKYKGTNYFLIGENHEIVFTDSNRKTVAQYAVLDYLIKDIKIVQ